MLNNKNINGIDVYLERRKTREYVGTLTHDGKDFIFTYNDIYLFKDKSIALGPDLPLSSKKHVAKSLFPTFEDRIPPKSSPSYLEYCRRAGINSSETDPFILLSTLGQKGASSFIFTPAFQKGISSGDIKNFRKQLNLTIREFSEIFDFSDSTIHRIEQNKTSGKDALKRLEIYYHFPEVALYEINKNRSKILDSRRKYAEDILKSKSYNLPIEKQFSLSTFSPEYVLAPFDELLKNCQNGVLAGLRLIENSDAFPQPILVESQFFQILWGEQAINIDTSKALFKKWILLKGFEEIHKCLRTVLERLYASKTVVREPNQDRTIDQIKTQLRQAKNFKWSHLLDQIDLLLDEPLQHRRHIESLNKVRNCLAHAHGITMPKYCNNSKNDRLTILGNRFKVFFKKGEKEMPAVIGSHSPENTALMLGAEEFQLDFLLNDEIKLSLNQFIDILNTCVFIRAEIGVKLK